MNPSYYNVPIACLFSQELVNNQMFEIKSQDIEYFTEFYT